MSTEEHAGAHWHGEPFVRVPRHRVRTLDASKRRPKTGNEDGGATPCGIDVEPDLRRGSNLGEFRERIHSATAGSARSADDEKRTSAGTCVAFDGGSKRSRVHREISRGRHFSESVGAQAGDSTDLHERMVALARHVDDGPGFQSGHAAALEFREPMREGDNDGGEIGFKAAT